MIRASITSRGFLIRLRPCLLLQQAEKVLSDVRMIGAAAYSARSAGSVLAPLSGAWPGGRWLRSAADIVALDWRRLFKARPWSQYPLIFSE
jgi:hypothetical protein